MIFLAMLAVATAAAWPFTRRPRDAARWGLGVAMAVAGVTHLVNPTPFLQHLPGWVPAAGALVAATGVVEILVGAALVAWRSRRRLVGWATALYLVAVFPANVYVAVAGVEVDGQPGGAYPWLRLPLQVLFVAWALWATAPPQGVEQEEGPIQAG